MLNEKKKVELNEEESKKIGGGYRESIAYDFDQGECYCSKYTIIKVLRNYTKLGLNSRVDCVCCDKEHWDKHRLKLKETYMSYTVEKLIDMEYLGKNYFE